MGQLINHFDIIIIGSGAGGATMAHELAATGKSILILERGEELPVEPQNWDPAAVFIDHRYRTDEKWYDKDGKPFAPNTHYWAGGNTSFYGAVLMRFRESDFKEIKHHGGISPAWPISYEELAPFYDRAEHAWHVRGTRDGIEADFIDPGTKPYPAPPLRHDPEVQDLAEHLRDNCGWHPFSLPLGVQRDDVNGPIEDMTARSNHCIRCTTCGGFPCKIKAKCDARTMALMPALEFGNVEMRTGHKVKRLLTDPAGKRITYVECETSQGARTYSADQFILAAGAVNSALILLASDNDQYKNGLANRSDQVGRNYMFHTMTATVSVSLHDADTTFPKTLGVNDFYHSDPNGGFDFPMGHIQLLEYMAGATLEGFAKDALPPAMQFDFITDLIPDTLSNAVAERALAFLTLSEDLPLFENRVYWDGDKIRLDYTYNNLEGHKRLVNYLEDALGRFRHEDGHFSIADHHFQVSQILPIYGTAHQCGTTRMGHDPLTSVVDKNCKAHDLDNLYVVDSGVFVSSAAVNPTLTIVANAMRVADHLKSMM